MMNFPTDCVSSCMSSVDTKSIGLPTDETYYRAHLPDCSSSTSTNTIAQCRIRLYGLDSLVYIIVLFEVSEDDFCGWRRGFPQHAHDGSICF
jgi:hypothetical protein